jgi:hypothetical protein
MTVISFKIPETLLRSAFQEWKMCGASFCIRPVVFNRRVMLWEMLSDYESHALRIAAMHSCSSSNNNSTQSIPELYTTTLFLPPALIWGRVVPWILGTVLVVALVHHVTFQCLVDRFASAVQLCSTIPSQQGAPQEQPEQPPLTVPQKRRLCYQWTNLLVNLCLGLAGLYCECQVLLQNSATSKSSLSSMVATALGWSALPPPPTVQQTVAGHVDYVVFSAVQIGYQLWAIPLGLYYVQESWPMLLHHGTVVVCASMSGFLTLGFRYWTPFFYGLVELSSVPLAVMNCCKDHAVLQQRYPTFYGRVRLAFAISFLYIRVVLFVPRQYYFLRDHYLLFSTSPIRLYQAYMATVWLSSFFLLNLQLYWASLIVQGLLGLRNRRTPKAKRATPKKLE